MPSLNGYATGGSCRECTTTLAELRQLWLSVTRNGTAGLVRRICAGASHPGWQVGVRPHSDPTPTPSRRMMSMDTRRQFLITAPLGVVGAAVACRDQQPATSGQ